VFHAAPSLFNALIPRDLVFTTQNELRRETLESQDVSSRVSSIEEEELISFAKMLLEDGTASSSLLAPWMLTCASQIMLAHHPDGISGATEELCQKLVHKAEASFPIRGLHQLFAHEAMGEQERQRRYADVVFFVLGSWCTAFKLQVTTLPYEAVQDVLCLVDDIFQENPDLTRSVLAI
jgi:hypothetical protein